MSGDQAEGTIRDMAGKAQEAAGRMMGDSATEMRGQARQFAGQAQSAFGDAVETVRDLTNDQPLIALLVAAGVGFLAGMLMARR